VPNNHLFKKTLHFIPSSGIFKKMAQSSSASMFEILSRRLQASKYGLSHKRKLLPPILKTVIEGGAVAIMLRSHFATAAFLHNHIAKSRPDFRTVIAEVE
jgi:hypothetical protein